MADAVRCTDCGGLVLWVADHRGRRVAIDALGIPAVMALSFTLPPADVRIEGFSATGDLLVGRSPVGDELPTGILHLAHARTCKEARARA
jgi:hypothetical protein